MLGVKQKKQTNKQITPQLWLKKAQKINLMSPNRPILYFPLYQGSGESSAILNYYQASRFRTSFGVYSGNKYRTVLEIPSHVSAYGLKMPEYTLQLHLGTSCPKSDWHKVSNHNQQKNKLYFLRTFFEVFFIVFKEKYTKQIG